MQLERLTLPRPAPARVLAVGAFLKNRACLLDGEQLICSPLHGDLGDAQACEALAASISALRDEASGPVAAVAHDLHPDFASTHQALAAAAHWAVPAQAVQHHLAHAASVMAEWGVQEPVLALSLDGVGLGTDGLVWGGELLWVAANLRQWRRLDHLPPLPLPGGDVAAREPWRLALAVAHGLGRQAEAAARWAPQVGDTPVRVVQQMLTQGLRCPTSTAAGRWFDAAAGLLGLSLRQEVEAEAAVALERCASTWLADHPNLKVTLPAGLRRAGRMPDLWPLAAQLFELGAVRGPAQVDAQGRGAFLFHLALAQGLADAVMGQAQALGLGCVVLGGGCFFNRLLSQLLRAELEAAGLRVLQPERLSCGDAGLALGQAWVAAHCLEL